MPEENFQRGSQYRFGPGSQMRFQLAKLPQRCRVDVTDHQIAVRHHYVVRQVLQDFAKIPAAFSAAVRLPALLMNCCPLRCQCGSHRFCLPPSCLTAGFHFRTARSLLDIKHQQESGRKFVHSTEHPFGHASQRVRWPFEAVFFDFDHVADFVHQQTESAFFRPHDDVHRFLFFAAIPESELPAQFHRGNNLTAKINQPAHHAGNQRNFGYLLIAQNFLHLLHWNAEIVSVENEGAELLRRGAHRWTPPPTSSSSGWELRSCNKSATSRRSVTLFCTTAEPRMPPCADGCSRAISSSTISRIR